METSMKKYMYIWLIGLKIDLIVRYFLGFNVDVKKLRWSSDIMK